MGFLDWFKEPVKEPIIKVVLPNPVSTSTETGINTKAIEDKIAELNKKNNEEIKPMGYTVSGVWTRKVINWPTIQEREQQKLLLDLHPYTVLTIKAWQDQYVKVYGQAEFDILKKSAPNFNMVASAKKQEWVKGGVWIEPEKPVEAVLKDGYEWVNTPFGKTQRPKQVVGVAAATATTTIDIEKIKTEIEQSAFKGSFEGTTAALEAWAAKTPNA
jgi:hypothetical protein